MWTHHRHRHRLCVVTDSSCSSYLDECSTLTIYHSDTYLFHASPRPCQTPTMTLIPPITITNNLHLPVLLSPPPLSNAKCRTTLPKNSMIDGSRLEEEEVRTQIWRNLVVEVVLDLGRGLDLRLVVSLSEVSLNRSTATDCSEAGAKKRRTNKA